MASTKAQHKTPQSRPDYIKWALIAGLVLIGLGTVVYLNRHRLFHHVPNVDFKRYPIMGIDVSNHNGDIDWDVVASRGIKFAYIKATEGTTFVDARYDSNSRRAAAAGLKVGAYHFFRNSRDGKAQAAHFMRVIGKSSVDLPLVVDIEEDGNDNDVPHDLVVQRLADMLNTLRDKGYDVMLYTNGNGRSTFHKKHFADCDLWLCSFSHPDSIAHVGHRIQQYSHWGNVKGIDGDVDLNIFMGSEIQWNRWLDELKH